MPDPDNDAPVPPDEWAAVTGDINAAMASKIAAHELLQQVVLPPTPPDVLASAEAFLRTAHDTRATALIGRLAEEVDRLRWSLTSGRHGPAPTREQHHHDMASMPAQDPGGLGPVTASETAGAFAVLRDIADAEPIEELAYSGEVRCVMCGALATPIEGGHHPHLISCPWARAVQIVGAKADG